MSELRMPGSDHLIALRIEAMLTRLTIVMFALYVAQSAFVVLLTVVVVKTLGTP